MQRTSSHASNRAPRPENCSGKKFRERFAIVRANFLGQSLTSLQGAGSGGVVVAPRPVAGPPHANVAPCSLIFPLTIFKK
jgi:hypothetical protein